MAYTVRQNPAYARNYDTTQKRKTKIVIHHGATTDFEGIGRTFSNPAYGVSAHFGVGRNQNVDQYVPTNMTAYHAGNYKVNQESIGIENVNSSGAPNWDVAPETFETLVELVRDQASRHGMLPLKVGVNLFAHSDFRATACPGKLKARLQELADRVNGGAPNPAPAPSPAPAPTPPSDNSGRVAQNGTFTPYSNMNIRRQPSLNGTIAAVLPRNNSVRYDSYIDREGIRWISYIGYSGNRNYIARRKLDNSVVYGSAV